MPDVFTRGKRSDVMSRMRSRGNKATELALVRVFRAHDITGWRRQMQIVIGRSRGDETQTSGGPSASVLIRAFSRRLLRVRPDFVFSKLRLAVFVDGCFWHGCPLHGTKAGNNAAFWRKKFAANKARDRLVTRTLRQNGWRVLRLWEHEFTRKREARLVGRIQKALTSWPIPLSI